MADGPVFDWPLEFTGGEHLVIPDWITVKEVLQKSYAVVANFAYDHDWPVRIVAITMVLGGLLWQAKLHVKARKKIYRLIRGKQMTRKDRQRQQKIIQADAIFNALDKLIESGKSLPHEINKTLRAVHNFLDMPDLVPLRPLDVSAMSNEERELLESILRSKTQLRKLILARKLIRIPGPKPGEDVYKKVTTLDVTRPKLGDGTRRRRHA